MTKTISLVFFILLLPFAAFSAEKVIIQAGLTFLPAEAEANLVTLKKNPSGLREAAVKEMNLHVGDTILFKNMDSNAHNVFSPPPSPSEFDLKSQDPGTSRSALFDKEGIYTVNCMIHPKMKMKVIVGK
jgi:plastocyanin